ncbi:MAG: hypothetical protein ABI361_09985 [Nitrososphaera sp.]|jgi:hypothetical protein
MSHKPKSIREIYADSISVNLSTLVRQLAERGVAADLIRTISAALAKAYDREAEKIAIECDADMMAIEGAPSPLELFVRCIRDYSKSNSIPESASSLLREYVTAMNDWG